ncbi:MAG TPA: hypothetical protein VE962_03235 [Actinomycetota bacterium]|nr:hypothetical protein [Actinomycetota bacterium]
MAQTKRRATRPAAPETDHVCPVGFCPIGMFLTVAGHARPEAVEHLVAAGREFMLALSSVMSARAEDLARPSPIEKIDVE